MNEEIVTKLVSKIEKLPNGTEMTTSELLGEVKESASNFSNQELLEIDRRMTEECKNKNIILDKSKHKGQIIGLPFHISFVIQK